MHLYNLQEELSLIVSVGGKFIYDLSFLIPTAGKMENDPVYLSYGDSVLRMSDLAILQSHQWLNDRIIVIGFYCEYCQLDKFIHLKKVV